MMKSSIPAIAVSALLAAVAPISGAFAQDQEDLARQVIEHNRTKEADAANAMVKTLSDDEQKVFFEALRDAGSFLSQKRNQEALDKLHDAEALLPEHPAVLNFKGSAYVNLRDFDRAADYFDKLVASFPTNWQGMFNRIEMDFVRHNWKEALSGFENLLERHAEVLPKPSLRLIDYKIAICHIKLGDTAKGKEIVEKYGFFDDTPIYYYGNAALAYDEGNEASAQEWINNARKIYSPAANAMYADALFEAGWLQML
ncbi:tetratricopeptide repeat protein [Sulfuriroseicoccus oceanibius]|uniref:Tetratricopeptide repeat protein n=1 Tax=Sulfuriroseicoccus oceanibius TaxID=2707525 RepID=A0A6B3LAA0_9BACT|nr:tetratricopeptide repeat protein [Sulfuriroseicoccus oceanibius]QQL44030.1 tetratricopeptide repeat protein [Sulfuriroseicoccus oceanibius]